MLKKALSGLEALSSRPGLPGLKEAPSSPSGPHAEEIGRWYYLVTDALGIRPRQDPVYSKESKEKRAPRFASGTVVEIHRRRRSGWTRWLGLAEGSWLFDISPKDRKVRMIEVEVQAGSWHYQVCVSQLTVLPIPQLGTPASCRTIPGQVGDVVTAIERVRPILGRGAFLRISEMSGWVLDFSQGTQVLRRCQANGEEEPLSPCGITAVMDEHGVFEDEEAEVGEWRYIVLDPKGVTLRAGATYDKSAKLKSRIEEGEIVHVLERREGADTVFLRVEGQAGATGWAFTTQPGADSFLRLLEVEVRQFNWYYQVVSSKGCALRQRCSLADSAKAGKTLEKGQLVHIRRRLEVGSTACLGLADGTWICYPKDQEPPVDGPLEVHKMSNEEAEITADGGVTLRKGPTELPWALTKKVLLDGSKVLAVRRAHLRGEMWMEVMQLGGLSGWMLACDLQLEFDLSSKPRRNR